MTRDFGRAGLTGTASRARTPPAPPPGLTTPRTG
jgi:hypothetical protein